MIEMIHIRRERLNHLTIADDLILDTEVDQDLETWIEIQIVEEKSTTPEEDLGVVVTIMIIMAEEDIDEEAGVEVGAGVLMVVGWVKKF